VAQNDTNIAFHFNPRLNVNELLFLVIQLFSTFEENVIVQNSKVAGEWQTEERCEMRFPFIHGQSFTLDFIAGIGQFIVRNKLNNNMMMNFINFSPILIAYFCTIFDSYRRTAIQRVFGTHRLSTH
jgi:hypothetical protein